MNFFSIFTETFNRRRTIKKTILSVSNQTFRNFNYTIIDFGSTDGTSEIIINTLKKIDKPNINFVQKKFNPNEMQRWNKQLKYTNGLYTVVLEGDDFFEKKYLEVAYKNIKKFKPGIYIGRSNKNDWGVKGLVNNANFRYDFMTLRFIPPPSEAIFKRSNKKKLYRYDSKNYKYCAEVSLYEKIVNDGYDVYFEKKIDNNLIHRGKSTKLKFSSKKVTDRYFFLNKNIKKLDSQQIKKINEDIGFVSSILLAYQFFYLKVEKIVLILFFKNLTIKNLKYFFYYLLYKCPQQFLLKKN